MVSIKLYINACLYHIYIVIIGHQLSTIDHRQPSIVGHQLSATIVLIHWKTLFLNNVENIISLNSRAQMRFKTPSENCCETLNVRDYSFNKNSGYFNMQKLQTSFCGCVCKYSIPVFCWSYVNKNECRNVIHLDNSSWYYILIYLDI